MRTLIIHFHILLGLFFPALASAVTLSSSAFANNGVIPNEYTYALAGQCSGSNLSPPLTIGAVPAGAQSLALTVIDPDGGDWVHWKAWNIPAGTTALPENSTLTADFDQAVNDFGATGYGGACPPTANHHYVFTLYALNTTFAAEPTITQLEQAALATATLTGVRSPSDNVSAAQVLEERVFAYAEANFHTLFAGTAVAGQYLQYTYRYYPGSGNYLAMDTDGMIYLLGPYTGNAVIAVGSAESVMGFITGWEAVAIPFSITAQDVSGNCTLDTSSFDGVLTPTGQDNLYTAVWIGGDVFAVTVPGSNTFDYSWAEGGGTTTEHQHVTFDAQSRSITGSADWAHTNGCYGVTTFTGSW